jgi:uncharacterized membrane protein
LEEEKMSLRKIVFTGLFTALICVLTMLSVPIPAGLGYVHLGDSLILISVIFLGIAAIPAAAIGSLLADVFLGYAVFAPFTLVIKGLLAFVAWLILRSYERREAPLLRSVLFAVLAAFPIVVGGYFFAEAMIAGSFVAGAPSVFLNVLQVFFGSALAIIFCLSLGSNRIEKIKKEILKF